MSEQVIKGDALQRISGLALIGGPIVLIVFNVLLPRADDPSDKAKAIQNIVDNVGFWEVGNLLLTAGIWAVLFGVVGIQRSISGGRAGAWARLGLYGVVVGTTLWSVIFAVNGLGLPAILETWDQASGNDKTILFHVGTSISHLVEALFSLTVVVYWLSLTFLGIGISASSSYARWQGWGLIAWGASSTVVGILIALIGINPVLQVIFAILSVLTTVWFLGLGVTMTRKAW